jgi:hypothetical protein
MVNVCSAMSISVRLPIPPGNRASTLLTPGARNYWNSHNFAELQDGAIDAVIEYARKLPSPQCEIFIALLGGAANRVPADAIAYAHREVQIVMNVHGRCDDPGQDAQCVSFSTSQFEA